MSTSYFSVGCSGKFGKGYDSLAVGVNSRNGTMHDLRGFEADVFSTREQPDCPSLRASSDINDPSKLACFSLLEWHPC
jgi:hypothetical protein